MAGYRYMMLPSLEGDGDEQLPYDAETVYGDDESLREGVELLENTRDALIGERGTALESLSIAVIGTISDHVRKLTGCRISLEEIVEDSIIGTTGAIAEVNNTLSDVWTKLSVQCPVAPSTNETVEITVADAVERLQKAVQLEDDYRWGWWCNLVMSGIDGGASREVAENAAERFMGTLFNVNMNTDPQRMRDRVERYAQRISEYLSEDAGDRIRAIVAESIGDLRVPETKT